MKFKIVFPPLKEKQVRGCHAFCYFQKAEAYQIPGADPLPCSQHDALLLQRSI